MNPLDFNKYFELDFNKFIIRGGLSRNMIIEVEKTNTTLTDRGDIRNRILIWKTEFKFKENKEELFFNLFGFNYDLLPDIFKDYNLYKKKYNNGSRETRFDIIEACSDEDYLAQYKHHYDYLKGKWIELRNVIINSNDITEKSDFISKEVFFGEYYEFLFVYCFLLAIGSTERRSKNDYLDNFIGQCCTNIMSLPSSKIITDPQILKNTQNMFCYFERSLNEILTKKLVA